MSVVRRALGRSTGTLAIALAAAGSLTVLIAATAIGGVARLTSLGSTTLWLATVLLVILLAYRRRHYLVFLTLFAIKLRATRPSWPAELRVESIGDAVTIAVDRYGVPTIRATSESDGLRALGFMCARDRLFQIDLARREAAGRMSEVFGPATLEADAHRRRLGYARRAPIVLAGLPDDQRRLLQAYVDGVNAYLGTLKKRPFEFSILGYDPEPWTCEDSVLVMLRTFEMLCGNEATARMLAVMQQTLPPEAVAFLTPPDDSYRVALNGERLPPDAAGVNSPPPIAALLGAWVDPTPSSAPVTLSHPSPGSNAWAVGGSRTVHGGAILANDTHLPLTLPTTWYRARLCYEDVDVSGVGLPGVPGTFCGSNTHVAWGVTNLCAECVRLTPLAPGDRVEAIVETIAVRGASPVELTVQTVLGRPVSPQPVLGRSVVIEWTALEPGAVNFALLGLHRARRLEDAISIVGRCGTPPVNVILAAADGRVAHTIAGRVASSTDAAASGGDSPRLPATVGQSSEFFLSANNRPSPVERAAVTGNFSSGCRAARISERLAAGSTIDARAMWDIQHDTVASFYEYYRSLLDDLQSPADSPPDPLLNEARRAVRMWNGRADADSRGLVILVQFRRVVAQAVLGPLLAPCMREPSFVYAWHNMDGPLRRLLDARCEDLLARLAQPSWDVLLRECLRRAASDVRTQLATASLSEVSWRQVNVLRPQHPVASVVPLLGWLLNWKSHSLPGCLESVAAAAPNFGAALRMVVAPGREAEGFVSIPGGQSEHPLSPNFDDHQNLWIEAQPLPFWMDAAVHTIRLVPTADPCRATP